MESSKISYNIMHAHSASLAKVIKTTLFLILTLSICSQKVQSDTWLSYGPRCFFAPGGDYVAEIFPPGERLNKKGSKTLCYLYHFDRLEDQTYKFTLVWKDSLRSYQPDRVFLNADGYLITLDPERYGRHNDQEIVIYNPKGIIVKSFPLDSLLSKDSMEIMQSVSARWWYNDARFFSFSFTEPPSFYILLKSGKAMEFNLKDGHYALAQATSFPILVEQALISYSNYEFRKNNYIELLFSSITEMLNAQNFKSK